ncbi:MAG: O-succinylhomoserine sulfhydrylase [Geminicoccaceae bacterium]
MDKHWRRQTRAIHGAIERSAHGETCEGLFLTSGFVYDRAEDAAERFAATQSGYMYSRVGNPTVAMFERRMAMLEGAEAACATATGMAAVSTTLLSQLRAGDRVVAARLLFGSCYWVLTELLPRFGIEVVLIDGTDLSAWEQALARPTRLVFFETPGNPTLELIDIAAVCERAHRAGAITVVDNVFATPVLQHPFALGADQVLYSATKHIDGQGRCLGGIILTDRETRDEVIHPYVKNAGPALSPFNAWVLIKGLETLDLRVEYQVRNAETVADWLENDPRIVRVLYPGLRSHPQYDLAKRQMKGGSTLIGFRLGRDRAHAFDVVNRLKLIRLSNNLGDAKSLITHPATTTHSKIPEDERQAMGITEDFVRLSVGLEDPQDLIEDLDQALSGSATSFSSASNAA